MKKLFLFAASFFLVLTIHAQTNPVDEMFNKYSEKEGFTTVYISSKLFNLFAEKEKESDDEHNIMRKLKSIRILTVEDSKLNVNLNFYNELSKKLNFSDYEEMMVVKEGGDVTKFLIRQDGDLISELLVIVGGPVENTLISIKGDLDMKSISELSKNIELEGLENLEDLDGEKLKNKK